jgi:hypothetical protein
MIHHGLMNIDWYRDLPSLMGSWHTGRRVYIHIGEIIVFSLLAIVVVIRMYLSDKSDQLKNSLKHCHKCNKITKVSRHTHLMTQEEKISFQKEHPHRFTEIGVNRATLLNFDVSETLILCDVCNTEIEAKLNKAKLA